MTVSAAGGGGQMCGVMRGVWVTRGAIRAGPGTEPAGGEVGAGSGGGTRQVPPDSDGGESSPELPADSRKPVAPMRTASRFRRQ